MKLNVVPFPGLAFHPDLSAHHLHQALADRQSQSGAANFRVVEVSACVNGLEQLGLLVPQSCQCPYPALKTASVTLSSDLSIDLGREHDLTLLGELYGVVSQVDQDLTEP